MSENHFRSHFSPFQINAQLFFKNVIKWPQPAILDVRKSLSIALLTISDQCTTFFFLKLYARKSLLIAFLALSDQYATIGHFVSPILAKIDRDLPPRGVNGYIKYEVDGPLLDEVMACTNFFQHIFSKWPPTAILVSRFSPKSIVCFHSGSLIAVKYEFDMGIGVTVTWNKPRRAATAETASTPKT